MKMTGTVINALTEEREMTNKEGKKEKANVAHVVLSCPGEEKGRVEIVNLRSYDPTWSLPKIGETWTTPRIRKYECFDGMVADVSA